jgi:hypothetical protein
LGNTQGTLPTFCASAVRRALMWWFVMASRLAASVLTCASEAALCCSEYSAMSGSVL